MKTMLFAILIACLSTGTVTAATASDSLERLKTYIEVDTINPPGNESRGVEFFSRILDAAAIAYETAESAPGRGNIWARLEGGEKPALLLLHHIDVVPATKSQWDTDPLKAVVQEGHLIGRGTLDTKSLGIMHLEAFLALHASGEPLSRDVIFMATADEEAGGLYGAGWLVDNRPEIFEDVGFLLNEGGRGMTAGENQWFTIEVAQKRPFWLRLTATDTPGHGSSPKTTSAPTRLIAALQRIQQQPFPPRIVDSVKQMFADLSDIEEPAWQDALRNIETHIQREEFMKQLQAEKPHLHALTRNTCSITVLKGSEKINVVPPVASAEIDCRILPDQDADEFIAAIRERVADEQITVEKILLFGPGQSRSNTSLYKVLETVSEAHYPGAAVISSVSTGFTDSHFFRDIGIESYGYGPFLVPANAASGVHGNNEKIGIEAFHQGVKTMTAVVQKFSTQ